MTRKTAESGAIPKTFYDKLVVIRVVAAALLFAAAMIIKVAPILQALLLIASALAVGYDLLMDGVLRAMNREYLNPPLIVVLCALLAFVIGFASEGAAFVILYRIGSITVDYARFGCCKSAINLMQYCDEVTVNEVTAIIDNPENLKTASETNILSASSFVLKCAFIFGTMYAILLPIFTNFSYSVSIHRALTIIFVSGCGSVALSVPYVYLTGICNNVQNGIIARRASAIESLTEVETVIVDKSAVAATENASFVTAQSDILDKNTFLMFVAHAVYFSSQPISKLIPPTANVQYRLEMISDYVDIPGYGVELNIGKAHVIFAIRELYIARGMDFIPDVLPSAPGNKMYYLVVADRYAGRVETASATTVLLPDLAACLRDLGVNKCVLASGDSRDEAEEFASAMDFDVFRGELSDETKAEYIAEEKAETGAGVAYVYTQGIEGHSAADVDIRVAERSRFADVLVMPDYENNITDFFANCSRIRAVASCNAVLAFAVKALLIFLSVSGWCNLWLAAIVDSAVSAITFILANGVTTESFVTKLFKNL